MQTYSIFGGFLRSSFPFPDLPRTETDRPSWEVVRSEQAPPRLPLQQLGEDEAGSGIGIRLFRAPDRLRLEYDRIGSYDISLDGARVTWYPGEHDCLDCARQSVLGRVLAACMYLQGVPCLHGSAVELDGVGIGFLAAKGAGKSTLAAALVAAGARLITDDMLPVLQRGSRAAAAPGVQRLRLWNDSVASLGSAGLHTEQAADGKRVAHPLSSAQRLQNEVPLDAIYLLSPVLAGGAAASRSPLPPVPAALTLVRHATLGPLLASEAEPLLEGAVRIAEQLSVHVLQLARDYAQIPEVVEHLFEWHTGTRRTHAATVVP
jgi:hypothetical protein